MQWICAVALMATLTAQQLPSPWRSYEERIPIGSTVKLTTTVGDRMTALLMLVDDTGITVKPKTRVPEPARRIRFDQIDELQQQEPERSNLTLGHAAGTGATVGGIILGSFLLLICMAGGCR